MATTNRYKPPAEELNPYDNSVYTPITPTTTTPPGATTNPNPPPNPPGGTTTPSPWASELWKIAQQLAQGPSQQAQGNTGSDPQSIINRSFQTAYGRAPSAADNAYWMGLWNQWGSNDPNYFEQRVLGMGAGGPDSAISGPYAGGTAGPGHLAGGGYGGVGGATLPDPPGGYFTNWQQSASRINAPSQFYIDPGQIGASSLDKVQSYQPTQFTKRQVTPSQAPPTPGMSEVIKPATLDQYRAGNVQQYTPNAQAQPLNELAAKMIQGASSMAMPNVSGLQEQQKEQLQALKEQSITQAQQGAASRGTLGGGALMGLEGRIQDAFAEDLTKSYRDLELQANQQGFANQLAAGSAASDIASQLAASGRADYTTGLQGTSLQEQLRQAEAQSQLANAGYGLQYGNYQLGRDAGELARAQYGLQAGGQEFSQNLAAQQFEAAQEQAQAQQYSLANQLALQLAQAQAQDQLGRANYGLDRGGFQLAQQNQGWQQQLGAANFNLGAQGFELQSQQAGLAEYLARLQNAQSVDQFGQQFGLASQAQADQRSQFGQTFGLQNQQFGLNKANSELSAQGMYVDLLKWLSDPKNFTGS